MKTIDMFLVLAACCILSATAVADAGHPSQGFERLDVPDSMLRGELPPEAWTDQLSFRPCAKPKAELTAAERYILFGSRPLHSGNSNPEPWRLKILFLAMTVKGTTGELPSAVTREMIDLTAADGQPVPDEYANWYRSPVTGEWPRLDSFEFTPGGVYLRMLTADEVRHLAQWDTVLTGLITTRKMALASGETGEGILLGDVYYYRFYGETGLLKEGFTYVFAPEQPK